jgi:outer membrane lipoprotein-sorting protein
MSRALVLSCLLFAAVAAAEESAADISKKSRERGSLNLVDLTAEMKLTTTSKDGKVKEQVLTSSAKKVNGRDASLARYSQPAGVAGVAVLTLAGQGNEGDDISMYLPKLKRVRKLAKTEKGKAFMDTDFSFADLGSTTANDEKVKRLADGKESGRDTYVLNGPADSDSPYSEVTVWVDKETYVPMKAEYKDKDGKPFKVYRTLKLKKFKDRVLAAESEMENLQTGSKTKVEILKIEDSKLSDEDFSDRGLERG